MKSKTKTSLSATFIGVGKVIMYSENYIITPESELVFRTKKIGKFKVRKFKDLKTKEIMSLFSFKKSKFKTTFVGIKINP